VAHAVISHLVQIDAPARVADLGAEALAELSAWVERYPGVVTGARGAGLLLLVAFRDEQTAGAVAAGCLERRVFVRQTQATGIRIFPARTIGREELFGGLRTVEEAVATVAG
jgi:acetylornithine/N-succinyldiaminopimelate aminotransferase